MGLGIWCDDVNYNGDGEVKSCWYWFLVDGREVAQMAAYILTHLPVDVCLKHLKEMMSNWDAKSGTVLEYNPYSDKVSYLCGVVK